MSPDEALPSFPTPAVRNRVLELGFGSGLWTRADLEAKWGVSTANKFIDEAKAYGWLVSPFRNQFWVPTASDLMVVPWLSPRLRDEFILSRALAASGIKFWSLSAWARSEGLLFAQPLFVTDLSRRDEPYAGRKPIPDLEKDVRRRAEIVSKIPFLDRLIIVPELGKLGRMNGTFTTIGKGRPEIVPPFTFMDAEEGTDRGGEPAKDAEVTRPTMIRYSLAPTLEDPAWLIAFLIALDLPRTNIVVRKIAQEAIEKDARKGKKQRREEDVLVEARRLSGRFGPALPNEDWKTLLRVAEFPFFLVPPDIWQEVASGTAARRFELTGNIGGKRNA